MAAGTAGHVVAVATLLAGTGLLVSACAGTPPPGPVTVQTASTGPGRPGPSSQAGIAAGPERRALAARYLAIAVAGNRRLDIDFDGLKGHDRRHLSAAQADLRDAAATERLFDRRLLGISFPPVTAAAARTLYRVNQARASLTIRAAASASLRRLRGYERRLDAANRPVEQQVRLIRQQLGLPPPDTS
jgi:hypothetical protein